MPSSIPAELLVRLQHSPSRTLAAVNVAMPGLRQQHLKYYLDGRDFTELVAQALDAFVGRESGSRLVQVPRFGTAVQDVVHYGAPKLMQALGPLGLVGVTRSTLAPLPQGSVVEGFLLQSIPFVGTDGAAMHQLVVLDDYGRAFCLRVSTYQRLAEESVSSDVPVEQADRLWAGRLLAQLDREVLAHPQGFRVRIGGLKGKGSAMVLCFGKTQRCRGCPVK